MNEEKPLTPEELKEKATGTEFEQFQKENFPTEEDIKDKFSDIRLNIIKQLKKFCDLNEEYYNIVSIWIMGTWIHKSFNTYPYLFFNAIKGSGKSRILSLIANLCWNGIVTVSMSEAVLFRTAEIRTLIIDEFESVGDRHKQALRELLNAAYKKGGHVERIKKIKNMNEEKMVVERFNVYCPVAMANIYGMDNVLADRCISLVLDRSDKSHITKLIENFDTDSSIVSLKNQILRTFSDTSVCHFFCASSTTVAECWNYYILRDTLVAYHTQDTQDTQVTLTQKDLNFFDKIRETKIEGRPLELFFPLFIIADMCGVLDETLKTAKSLIQEKKKDDMAENRDMELISYLNKMIKTDDFISITKIYNDLKEDDKDWITADWIGRALKRMNILTERRRTSMGREVRINWKKLESTVKVLFPEEEIEEEKIEIKEKKGGK